MAGRTYRFLEERAQYPFGFGLTYGDVVVTEARVCEVKKEGERRRERAESGYKVSVKATVRNQGGCDTDDVIQIYIKNRDSEYAVKNPELCAFKRVHLKSGEVREVTLQIGHKAFTVVNHAGERILDGVHYDPYAGTFQPDKRSVKLMGRETVRMELDLGKTGDIC